ncbi:MAG: D-aminoacyl-tRNA deacylase [Gammaproteobacteria bacterium]
MIALIQRVIQANVLVDNKEIGSIQGGLLVLLGVEKGDGQVQAQRLVERILGYRVFEDEQGKMNLSLKDTQGELLLVPQFTLAANTDKGMRPSFSSAAAPDEGRFWFEQVVELARQSLPVVEIGQFGADMKVGLVNDGPVTFWLQTH